MVRKNSTLIYLFAFLLFAGAVGYMVWSGVSSEKAYFLNVSEALAMPAERVQSSRVFGTVADQGIVRPEDSLGVRFALEDYDTPTRIVLVDYHGVVPDAFEPGAEVIVEGAMRDGLFQAKILMTKCPSKYERANRV